MKRIESEEVRKLRDVPKGAFIRRLHKDGTPMQVTYRKEEYDRSIRRYWCVCCDDTSLEAIMSPDTLVLVGFTY